MPIREVQGVSIVAWPQPEAVSTAPAEIRALFEQGQGVERLLLDLSACPDLNPDALEALTEAYRLCTDRQARVGMFGMTHATTQLVEILGLDKLLPPHLGADEGQALAAIRNGAQAPAALQELTFEVPAAAPGVELTFDLDSAPAPSSPVELEFDLGDVATAPTARFNPGAVSAAIESAGGGSNAAVGLTTVLWADLTTQGYVIGGEGSDEIMAAVASPAPPAARAEDDAGTIDLGDVLPAQRAVEDEGSDEGSAWTAAPISPAAGIDFNAAPAPAGLFGGPPPANPFANPAAFGGAAMVSSGLFGGGQAEFSPVDAGAADALPPAAVAQARAAAPLPPLPAPAAVEDDEPEDSDETIMFAPGALDLALAAAAAAAAEEAEAAPDPTPADPPPPLVSATPAPVTAPAPVAAAPQAGLTDDETVMISPGMLDAALLAEVAKAAGQESSFAPPPTPEPEPAPAPAPVVVPTGDEVAVRLFLLDHGIKSDTHVELLSRLLKEERVVGPSDFDLAGDLRPLLDQLAQSRILKRQRSARVKGGSGYLLAPSPQARGTVTRLARMWADPQGRAKVSAWLNEG